MRHRQSATIFVGRLDNVQASCEKYINVRRVAQVCKISIATKNMENITKPYHLIIPLTIVQVI